MTNMFDAVVRDEAALRAALAEADIAPMLMVLAQLSGDLEILDEVAPHIHGAWSFLESVPEDRSKRCESAWSQFYGNTRPASANRRGTYPLRRCRR